MMMHSKKAFTLVEIMIVVAIIGILIAIAVPSFIRAREKSRQNACIENLTKIQGAKEQWALENNAGADASPGWSDLIGDDLYIRKTPVCPSSGTYTIYEINVVPGCNFESREEFPHSILPEGPPI